MIPVSATGWSVKGEKTEQVQASEANITAALAVAMLQGPSLCQLIFGGKTGAVLPQEPVESHWQSTDSMFSFVQFLEKLLNGFMRSSTTSHPDGILSRLLGPTFSRIILRRPLRSCLRLGKRTRPEVSSDRARRASYQR